MSNDNKDYTKAAVEQLRKMYSNEDVFHESIKEHEIPEQITSHSARALLDTAFQVYLQDVIRREVAKEIARLELNQKSVLSAQSIRKLCLADNPMLTPFQEEKIVINGVSGGLSACSYDLHLKQDLILGVHPGILIRDTLLNYPSYDAENVIKQLRSNLHNYPKHTAISSTIEHFNIPSNVCAKVADKSTYARLHVSAYNTHFDPHFRGGGTLELVNNSETLLDLKAGTPICQMVFYWLDEPTEKPYDGKYQNQGKEPTAAILEGM
jgi:dCTP deaminase